MLSLFFNDKGVIHREYVPEGTICGTVQARAARWSLVANSGLLIYGPRKEDTVPASGTLYVPHPPLASTGPWCVTGSCYALCLRVSSFLAELLHPPSNCWFIATTFTIHFFRHSRYFCCFFPSHHENSNNRMHFERGVHVHRQLHCTRLTRASRTCSLWNFGQCVPKLKL